MKRIVVAGASLAGLRAAQTLRAEGFGGALVLVGDEPYMPYDRPPLLKSALMEGTSYAAQAKAQATATDLPVPGDLDATWLLGTRAVGLDAYGKTVRLADGRELPYDGLVIATGAAARVPAALTPLPAGVHTLRTRDEAAALRAALVPGRRAVVVGGGFLGSEIAASAGVCGLDVTLVVPEERALLRQVGYSASQFIAGLHHSAGIRVVGGRRAEVLDGGARLTAVGLDDGTELAADIAVLALGAVPNVGWLAGSGIALDGGVRCDERLRVLSTDGTPLPGIVAAGDVTDSLGHWSNAVEQAAVAARTLVHGDAAQPLAAVPSFWSDLHGVTLRAVGRPDIADEERTAEYNLAGRHLEVTYHRAGRLVGAATIGRNSRLAAHRRLLAESAFARA
ncbi:NAD(P)/FAD-dependent oxidoreductase [Yinghuangia soli]|uniref:FAD-dependent oxidoreductase n=1 Tax=Yinghuangia soli TaxID=2908204 RepID=A0AA41U1Z3_9ACTN|nr:FAD-dependent oxidoreductase [Yinghuangia soli]MCF2526589.1 FAD-dependent oxidoreductase [Yinghuangia soli]